MFHTAISTLKSVPKGKKEGWKIHRYLSLFSNFLDSLIIISCTYLMYFSYHFRVWIKVIVSEEFIFLYSASNISKSLLASKTASILQ